MVRQEGFTCHILPLRHVEHARYRENTGVNSLKIRVLPRHPEKDGPISPKIQTPDLIVYFVGTRKFANAYNHKQISRLHRKYTADTTAHALERAIMQKLPRAGFVLCIVLLAIKLL